MNCKRVYVEIGICKTEPKETQNDQNNIKNCGTENRYRTVKSSIDETMSQQSTIPEQAANCECGGLGTRYRVNDTNDVAFRLIDKGARPGYGLFLTIDRIEARVDNVYGYVTDPTKNTDLTRKFYWEQAIRKPLRVDIAALGAFHAASKARIDQFKWQDSEMEAVKGRALGGPPSTHVGADAKIKTNPKNICGRRNFEVRIDSKVHRFARLRKSLPHLQLDMWRCGVKGSDKSVRVPLPKFFSTWSTRVLSSRECAEIRGRHRRRPVSRSRSTTARIAKRKCC
jgi:hypothetical protein